MTDFFVEGNSERYFLNTRIGCRGRCCYCYLPLLKISDHKKTLKATEIINLLEENTVLNKGKHGTIFSIGCYSECWDSINKEETIRLLKFLLKWGNPIQTATKMSIKTTDIQSLAQHIQWQNQLSVYVSCPVLSNSDRYEINVESIPERLKTIEICSTFNIPAILYIKPVIKGITIKDIEKYIQIVKTHNISAVVGTSFSLEKNNDLAPIGNGNLFCDDVSEDQNKIILELSKYTNVYHNSKEVIESFRSIKC